MLSTIANRFGGNENLCLKSSDECALTHKKHPKLGLNSELSDPKLIQASNADLKGKKPF